MTTHIMLDIESLGVRPGAVILSVAFVRFSDEAHVTLNLSLQDQEALGMLRDTATEAWWAEQERTAPGAWEKATSNPFSLQVALPYISSWLQWAAPAGDALIWCHGATFDAPLLEELFRRANAPCPWKFWQVRDTRTLYDLALVNPKDFAVPPPHVALNDALGQTRAANAALAVLARAHAA